MCHFLQHLCDLQLRHRVESVVAFSDNYVESCQNVCTPFTHINYCLS